MNQHNNDLDILGLNDPMKRKAASAQMTSARDVAEYYEYQERQRSALAARNKAQTDAQLERDRIAEMRYQDNERAMKERERIEAIRYRETKRLSLIALGIAVLSAIISIFK